MNFAVGPIKSLSQAFLDKSIPPEACNSSLSIDTILILKPLIHNIFV